MVSPYNKREQRNRRRGVNHRRVSKQLLSREGRNNLRDNAESGQDHNVHFRVPEEPENMLEHNRVAATSSIKKARAKELIS